MRIPPLPPDAWDDRARDALAGMLPEHRRNPAAAGNAPASILIGAAVGLTGRYASGGEQIKNGLLVQEFEQALSSLHLQAEALRDEMGRAPV